MLKDKFISVVIPALNEENAIGDVIRDLPMWIDQIIVSDNGSNDNTAAVAEQLGAQVVFELEPGYGSACLKGLSAVDQRVDVIAFIDGDYSDFPEDIHKIVDPIVAGEADFVLASRAKGLVQKGALTPAQKFGNWLATWLMRRIWAAPYSDLGPFRAIDAALLERLAMEDRNYGWTIEMQIKAVLAGARILEVPARYRQRIGVSKISGTISGSVKAGYKILHTIWKYRKLERPQM
ncbi:MAG: glycosyl hydrolase [Rhodomicrobium sp.]|nr:MAG: glycosyl hydrolase [Rhodomicrobium sp.]